MQEELRRNILGTGIGGACEFGTAAIPLVPASVTIAFMFHPVPALRGPTRILAGWHSRRMALHTEQVELRRGGVGAAHRLSATCCGYLGVRTGWAWHTAGHPHAAGT